MAKQISFFYRKILLVFFGVLLAPFLKLFGTGSEAFATNGACYAGSCSVGDTHYVACGTSQLQKQVCQSCSYQTTCVPTFDPGCDPSNPPLITVTGTQWIDSGTCTTYANQCSSGQTSSQACSNVVGSGTQTRSCTSLVVGSSTYWMWGAYGTCVYSSCANATDVLDSGLCYCKASCAMTNGYGSLIAQVRLSSSCPITIVSSSSVAP